MASWLTGAPFTISIFVVGLALIFRFQSRSRTERETGLSEVYRELEKKHFDNDQDRLYRQKVDALRDGLAKALPDLVTLNSSMVDMEPWERVGHCSMLEDEEATVEINLFLLINEFLTHLVTPLIYSSTILSSYTPDPSLFSIDLLSVFSAYEALTAWRRWLPSMIKHRLAENRLTQAIISFRIMLDIYLVRGQKDDQEAEQRPSQFIQDLRKQTREGTVVSAEQKQFTLTPASEAEVSHDVAFLLRRLPQTHSIIFWMLVHFSKDSATLADLRRELTSSNAVSATQPPPLNPNTAISEPPTLSINSSKLMACSWLRSAYHHTVTALGVDGDVDRWPEMECMMFVAGFFVLYDLLPRGEGEAWPEMPRKVGDGMVRRKAMVPGVDRLRVRKRGVPVRQ